MLDGSKTCTSRNKRCGDVGDTFEQWGYQFELTAVYKLVLKDVRDLKYKAEGFTQPGDFVTIWDELHPGRKFVPEQFVWVHEFRCLG